MNKVIDIPPNSEVYLVIVWDERQQRFDVIEFVYNYVNP